MLREALMLADLCPNVWLDTSSSNRWMAYEGLDLRSVFRRAIETAGHQRLLFGTDSSYFPRGWHAAVFEAQVKALYELGVEAAEAQQIFGGNLERLHAPRLEAVNRMIAARA
jgi:predicted TIM-barrel fold metal-dependent hydrolase